MTSPVPSWSCCEKCRVFFVTPEVRAKLENVAEQPESFGRNCFMEMFGAFGIEPADKPPARCSRCGLPCRVSTKPIER